MCAERWSNRDVWAACAAPAVPKTGATTSKWFIQVRRVAERKRRRGRRTPAHQAVAHRPAVAPGFAAMERRSLGQPALSRNWSTWSISRGKRARARTASELRMQTMRPVRNRGVRRGPSAAGCGAPGAFTPQSPPAARSCTATAEASSGSGSGYLRGMRHMRAPSALRRSPWRADLRLHSGGVSGLSQCVL
jgi:hypothetical protein